MYLVPFIYASWAHCRLQLATRNCMRMECERTHAYACVCVCVQSSFMYFEICYFFGGCSFMSCHREWCCWTGRNISATIIRHSISNRKIQLIFIINFLFFFLNATTKYYYGRTPHIIYADAITHSALRTPCNTQHTFTVMFRTVFVKWMEKRKINPQN